MRLATPATFALPSEEVRLRSPRASSPHEGTRTSSRGARATTTDAHVHDVAILLHVRKLHRATVVHVWVVTKSPGGSASVDQDVTLGARASTGDEADGVWNVVGGVFSGDAPPPPSPAPPESPAPSAPPPSSSPLPPTPAEEANASPRDADAVSPPVAEDRERPLLRVGAAIEAGSRHFAYVDRLSPTLRPYDLFAAPLAALRVEVSPFGHSGNVGVDGLGLAAEYARALSWRRPTLPGRPSRRPGRRFHADLREGFAFGRAVVRGSRRIRHDKVSLSTTLWGPGPRRPSVGYRILRAGFDGQVTLRDFAVYAGTQATSTSSPPALWRRFCPRATVGGIAASVGLPLASVAASRPVVRARVHALL